jgi:hypothetical protein
MSQAKEFLVNNALIYSVILNGESSYFLLLNPTLKHGQALKEYFETQELRVDITYNEVDDYYLLPTIGENIGKVSDEHQEIIKEICENYLSERIYLAFTNGTFVFCDFNYLNDKPDSKILGVILKTAHEFQNLFLTASDEIVINKFEFEVQGEEGICSLIFSCTDNSDIR